MGNACAQVVIDAISRAGARGPADMTAMREAVRKAGTDTAAKYTTIVGDITFKIYGDTSGEDRFDLLGRPGWRERQG